MRRLPELTPAVNAHWAAEKLMPVGTTCMCLCVQAIAPATHTATASTSTLCKVLTWHLAHTWQDTAAAGAQPCLMHQADWLAYLLHGVCFSHGAPATARHRTLPPQQQQQQDHSACLAMWVLQRGILVLHC